MPRRNLWVIAGIAIFSLVCYERADRNPLGRYFSEVVDRIEGRYVDPVDRQALWSGAVRGMVEQLHDPYSEYISPEDAAELDEILDQRFAGIGIQVTLDPQTKRLTVISPLVGSPAYRAGVLAGDVIAEIDGHTARDLTMPEALKLLRGHVGEPVRLTVERPGQKELVTLPTIRREIVNVESVMGDSRNGDDAWDFVLQHDPTIGYLRIVNFGEHTTDEVKAALGRLRAAGVKGLILDLRNNPGGLLDAALGVSDQFLAVAQPIVSIRARDKDLRQDFFAKGVGNFLDIPMVVLVNHGSASASEIVAACLQDAGRAVVIGERSWGKGTVQTMIPLHAGQGSLKLTTADYVRPNGHNIHRRQGATDKDEWGVSPDAGQEVKMTDDELERWMKWRADRDVVRPHADRKPTDDKAGGTGGEKKAVPDKNDPLGNDVPLQRAVDYLRSKIG